MSSSPPVIRTTDSLPPAWDRPGVYVANLFSLFFGNVRQTDDLCAEVGRLETYGGRLVPVLGLIYQGDGANTVLLEQEPDARLLAYFRDRLGLVLPDIQVWGHADHARLSLAGAGSVPPAAATMMARLRRIPDGWIDGFVTDPALEVLARETGLMLLNSRQGSYEGNNKLLLHHHLSAQGLPVFDTHLAGNLDQINHALRQLRRVGYERAGIKSQIGASGIGLWQLATDASAADLPDHCFHEGDCLVQGWLDQELPDVMAVHSPSVQLFVRPEAIHLYDLTDQILSAESVHQGNRAPPDWLHDDPATREEIMRQAAMVGTWLQGRGYRGTASIDFHVTDRSGGREVRVCEVNARITGATYPALLARHLAPGQAWLMRNLRFAPAVSPAAILGPLDRAGLLFSPGDPCALLPINFNAHPHGTVTKGQFLCLADDPGTAAQLLDEVARQLPLADCFDRD